jgi:hypothetical protein
MITEARRQARNSLYARSGAASNPSTCPVRALSTWKSATGIIEGALFRGADRHGRVGPIRLHKDSVGLIIKRAVEAAGLDPA